MIFTYLLFLLVPMLWLETTVNHDVCYDYCGGTCRAHRCNVGEVAAEDHYYNNYDASCSHYCGEGRVCCVEDYDICKYYCDGTCRAGHCNDGEMSTGDNDYSFYYYHYYFYYDIHCHNYCRKTGRVCCIEDYDMCAHYCGGTCRAHKCNRDEREDDYCADYCGLKDRVCCVPD
ncbi:uncharacterized protein LOC102803415 [Saccoglossus kowalevskii]